MKEPFQPIGFTIGVPTDKQSSTGVQKIRLAGITSDKTPTKEELIQQREEETRSQTKKENNIITETDRQNAEIDANIENAVTPRWQKGLKLAKNAANFGLGAGVLAGTAMSSPYFAAAGPGGLAAVGGLQGAALGMMGNALENQYGFNAGLTTGSAVKDAILGATGEAVLGPMIGKGLNWVGNKIAPIYKPVEHKVSDLIQKGTSTVSGALDALDLLGGLRLISDAIKGYKYIKHISNPKSVLDWSFDSWFNQNGRTNADFYDKLSLLKHLPEYVDIELQSKANGTWLQMNDGTMFKGDPREWVMMQSKAFKNSGLGETQVISGDWAHRIPNTSDYDVWGVTDKDAYKAYNFGTDGFGRTTVYGYVYPKKSQILEINLPKDGIYWGQIPKQYIPAKSNLYPHQSVLSADNIVEGSKNNGFDITRINNVIEGTPGNSPVDDIIIHANTPRKIISGSNGNFNMSDKNPFKIVVPGLIATGITTEVDTKKSGGTIHIKKKNKGKFTDYCGGKVTEECIRKGKNSSNPTTRKRATFAQNARRWKHQEGGKINYLNYFS